MEGGAVVALSDAPSAGGESWGDDGAITVESATRRGLDRIPSAGGAATLLTDVASSELYNGIPKVLPGGKAVLFTARALNQTSAADTVEVVTVADRRRKVLVRGGSSPQYLSGHLLYTNKSTLFAIGFDPDKLETRGSAVPVLDDVAFHAGTYGAQYDVSRNGTLVYRRSSGSAAAGKTTIQWVDPAGKRTPLVAKPDRYANPRLSPDGKRLALQIDEDGASNIWVYDPQRDSMTRLTSTGGNAAPVWSPDGRYVVFVAVGKGIFQTRSDGASQPQPLMESRNFQVPWSFTPDGKRLAFFDIDGSQVQIWTVPVEDQGGQLKGGKAEQFLKDSFVDQVPVFSPDGRWLAYHSNESGRNEVYVRPFPAPAAGQGGKWQISNSGGTLPFWSRNGRDLIYQSGDQLMAASYTAKGDAFVADKPRVWIAKLGGTGFSLGPDDGRVAVITPVDSPEAPKQEHEVVFLENFADELRRKVPVNGK